MLNLVRDVDWSLETPIFDKIGNSRLLKCLFKNIKWLPLLGFLHQLYSTTYKYNVSTYISYSYLRPKCCHLRYWYWNRQGTSIFGSCLTIQCGIAYGTFSHLASLLMCLGLSVFFYPVFPILFCILWGQQQQQKQQLLLLSTLWIGLPWFWRPTNSNWEKCGEDTSSIQHE